MSYELKKFEHAGKTVRIVSDDDPLNPRTDWDNLGTITYREGSRYILGDKATTTEEMEEIAARRDVICLPVYAYIHSGIALNTTGFHCPWDSGQSGIIYVEREKVRKEWGKKRISPKLYNQILEVLKIHEPELEKEEGWDQVIKILETVGIDAARARDYPHQLSGGMKQRALIAMALVNNPDIVIADEPVTALDVIVQSQVLKATKELQSKFDLSMIMITHDLSVIAEVCETLAIMYAGKLVEYGDLRTLFKEPFHPYTQALINAFPSITGPKKDLYDIGGFPPDLRNPPSGCRFHPRCPKAMPICSKKEPSNTPIKSGYVACWLYEEDEK